MAKRFGRNQRRHLREEIATKNELLSEALNRSAARGREAAELRNRLTRWAEEILHLMGEDSAFNEQLRRVRSNGMLDRLMLSPVPAPISMRDRAPRWEQVSSVIEACILRCNIKSDDLRGHVAVEIGDHMGSLAGYAMSRDRREAWTPRDIHYVAELIANQMAKVLAHERKGKAA